MLEYQNEMNELPEISDTSEWRILIKGVNDETIICPTISI